MKAFLLNQAGIRVPALAGSKVFALFLVLMQCSLFVDANALTRYSLKHRSAQEIKQTLLPLLPEGSSIVVDNNSVIVSAPASMKKSVASVIRQIDRPQQQLLVTVFRGRHPEKKGHIIHSTHHGAQVQESIVTQNGQAIAITEKNVVRIPVSDRVDIIRSASAHSVNGSASISDDSLLDNPISLDQKSSQLIDVPTGLYLRATIQEQANNKTLVNIASTVISEVESSTHGNTDLRRQEQIALTRSVESIHRIPINQWHLLSRQHHFSHPSEFAKKGQSASTIYSTAAQTKNHSVWIKVEVFK